MPTPARNTLAVIGAGPVGLEIASAALDRGFDVHVFERGEVGTHPLAWGHVTMFTPWRMNLGPSAAARLERSGWQAPDPEAHPTGAELVERYLEPLAALPELAARIHTHAQVVFVARSGALKESPMGDARREHPFRLLVRDRSGRENFLHAFAVIDASGVYGSPRWAGDGGIPARGELYLAPQLSYHLDDVLGLRRERYAGKRTLVIGSGTTAATLVCDLVRLAGEAPGTEAVWATRATIETLCVIPDDPLPARRELWARARALALGEHPAVRHVGGARVEGFEFNSATHRYRTTLMLGEAPRVEETDQIIVAAGYGPDGSIDRELQVHECSATRAAMNLAGILREAGATADLRDAPASGAELLEHPEPDYFRVGHKAYGGHPHFLLETGYRQAAQIVSRLAERIGAAARS